MQLDLSSVMHLLDGPLISQCFCFQELLTELTHCSVLAFSTLQVLYPVGGFTAI